MAQIESLWHIDKTTTVQTSRCGMQQINPRSSNRCMAFHLFFELCNAVPYSWPWVIQMRLLDADTATFKHECAAVLISESYAITASHCFLSSDNPKHWKAIGGRHLKDVNETKNQPRNIIKIVMFPNDGDNILDKDLAIIKFDQPMKINTYVFQQKKQLKVTNVLWLDGEMSNVYTTQKGLKDNAMPIVNTDKCGGPKNLTENITPYMMCAGFQKGRHDACQIDSGSPLMCKFGSVWYIQGLATFGVDCSQPHLPGVYANVYEFVSWITDQITKL
ncbi:Hypothetical predicted protein [Mytilus galloprovincialis]|uniref:Peptidase S1 domain-containing protein n=1 Tax=Mytilus galloprovincialis TaxID=29158 RepID=A0A8B6EAS6_MYTGA|nr:Hypothetical predicted protein [Mytilus galloprovincialis]